MEGRRIGGKGKEGKKGRPTPKARRMGGQESK